MKPGRAQHVARGRLHAVFSVAALVLLAFVPYWNALKADFTLDDFPIIVDNPVIRDLKKAGDIFLSDYWETGTQQGLGVYRPFSILSYAVEYSVEGLKPGGYHLTNLVLHAINTLLLFLIAIALLGSLSAAFTAAALFAVHPVHTEAVTSIVGRAELLATLCFLSGLLVVAGGARSVFAQAKRRDIPVSHGIGVAIPLGLFYLLGLLSKETAVTLPLVYAAWVWSGGKTTPAGGKNGSNARQAFLFPWKEAAAMSAAALVYFVLRSRALTAARHIWIGFASASSYERILTASRVLMEYIGLLLFPRILSADYSQSQVPVAHSILEVPVLLSIMLWAALAFVGIRLWNRNRPISISLLWFFITVLPVSNLLLTVGVGKAERILYLPSAGFCLLAGALAGLVGGKKAPPGVFGWVLLWAALLVLGFRTYLRNADWKDNLTLAQATVEASPDSALFNRIAAVQHRRQGDPAGALPYLQQLTRLEPRNASAFFNLGNACLDLKRFPDAIAAFEQALQLQPGYIEALNNLGRAQKEAGQYSNAVRTFSHALSLNRGRVEIYVNFGALYLKMGAFAQSVQVSKDGLRLFPDSAALHLNLSFALAGLGLAPQAEEERRQALRLDPSLAR